MKNLFPISYGIAQYQAPDFWKQSSSEHYILNSFSTPITGVASSANYKLDASFLSSAGYTITSPAITSPVNSSTAHWEIAVFAILILAAMLGVFMFIKRKSQGG